MLNCFHTEVPGRPPRNPMGLFRTFIIMRMKVVRSLREMTRLLDADRRLRSLCLIKPAEKGYTRSVLSRFTHKIGETRLITIIEEKVIKLLKRNGARDVDSVFDASFIKAWSTRDPVNGQKGKSDKEARVGRARADPSILVTSCIWPSIPRPCFLWLALTLLPTRTNRNIPSTYWRKRG